jgi:uncharacterized protein (TIGR03435 family)
MRTRGLSAVALATCVSCTAAAQTVSFDVASVKPNTSGDARISAGVTPGGYAATNATLRLLVMSAFGVRRDQVIGGPAWMDADRFDIAARAPEGAAPASMPLRLRELLRERFNLLAHVESRDAAIYALARARPAGPLSPNLKPSALACTPGAPGNPCRLSGTIGAVSGSLTATGQTMPDFAGYLGRNVDRPVVDRTGLPGRFDFEMAWTADDTRGLTTDDVSRQNDRGILFTALIEQLGLRLEASRGPVEFLVIDRVERPAAD